MGRLDKFKTDRNFRGGPVELPDDGPPKRPYISVYCQFMMRDRFDRAAPEIDCQRCCQFTFPDEEPFKTHFRENIIRFMQEHCPHKDRIKVRFTKIE
jgi:hypothetical protein